MNVDADLARQLEVAFLTGVEANFEGAKGRQFRGSRWKLLRQDERDSVRARMASLRMYDRDLLQRLPANRRIILQGYERRWLFGKRRTGTAIAAVLSPLKHLISGSSEPAPPVGLAELKEHLHKLVEDGRTAHVIGVCSTSGFTEEARRARLSFANATVVLVEPKEGGGWRVMNTGDAVPEAVLELFDPEDVSDKAARVMAHLDDRSADLLTGGLSVSSVARRLDLPAPVVEAVFRRRAADQPELRVSTHDGELLLYRGAVDDPVPEKQAMSMLDRIRQILSREGDEVHKINLLSERRAALAQRRDRIYEDISKLEQREGEFLKQGRASGQSQVVKRRLAAQLAQLRKDIRRHNTTANMLNEQINIINTNVHNLTLIQQGQMAQLPSTEELTENAVQAEEMLESLKADAELVSGLDTGMSDVMTSDEEQAILAEFEQEEPSAAAARPAPTEAVSPPPTSVRATESEPRAATPQPSDIDQKDRPSRTADPEAS